MRPSTELIIVVPAVVAVVALSGVIWASLTNLKRRERLLYTLVITAWIVAVMLAKVAG